MRASAELCVCSTALVGMASICPTPTNPIHATNPTPTTQQHAAVLLHAAIPRAATLTRNRSAG
eukprot:6602550-Prymnesium_polylepis.1